MIGRFVGLWVLLGAALGGCDGQQYVSPDTVDLVIENDASGVTRVRRCNYIPVLLGSRVEWRYTIDGDLKAVISITRAQIEVSFEGDSGEAAPFVIKPKDLDDESGSASFTAENPPEGYTVRLTAGCTPDYE